MARYNVYGIGNALLDMIYEVGPDFLQANNIQKGLMTLIDEQKHADLLKILKGLSSHKSCGGSAANTMIAVSQLGGQAFYSCKVASDSYGKDYYDDMCRNGVDSNLRDGLKEGITGKCIVFITPDADRTMNTYLGITETFSEEELHPSALNVSDFLYIEGYLVTSQTGKQAAITARKLARENQIKVALTFSDPQIVKHFRDGFLDIMGGKIDLLFCNEEEAKAFTECEDMKNVCDELKKVTHCFAITRGHQGAVVYDGRLQIEIPGVAVRAVDTNGAGDLFAGAFLYAITHGCDYQMAAALACQCSAKLVTVAGARLTKDQILKIKQSVLGV